MRVLGIVGSVTSDSRTRRAIETVLDGASGSIDADLGAGGGGGTDDDGVGAGDDGAGTDDEGDDGIETSVLHLAEYELETADGRGIDEYEGDTAAALDLVIESDAYVIGSPVYRASYSGALKNLFDMIPRGMWQADVAPLANSAVGLVATGATNHHYLAIDDELRPAMAFFGAHAVGGSVYATDEHFENGEITDEEIRDRLAHLGRATVEQARAIDRSEALSALGPQF
ncbi:NADPH-dependent FMN reductase [Halobacteriales archaeon QS_8_65_32]|jgi:FMN reductase|nr:MAG: NADPH-dependent FMN reductase [Halobacteriales archaeon QS_8_65_32]